MYQYSEWIQTISTGNNLLDKASQTSETLAELLSRANQWLFFCKLSTYFSFIHHSCQKLLLDKDKSAYNSWRFEILIYMNVLSIWKRKIHPSSSIAKVPSTIIAKSLV